jgi:hypothetical protein
MQAGRNPDRALFPGGRLHVRKLPFSVGLVGWELSCSSRTNRRKSCSEVPAQRGEAGVGRIEAHGTAPEPSLMQ